MTQSVELLLDEGLDALVRSDWDALAVAGLPSQGRHRSASNRPHVTLAAMKAVDAALEPQMARALGGFPVPVACAPGAADLTNAVTAALTRI